MQTRWLLGRVARELHKTKNEKEGVLLQALQEGEIRAFVLLLNNSLQVDIPADVWKEITDVNFNVRRRYNGRWCSSKFKISPKFAEAAATKTIQKTLENLISGSQTEFECERNSDWLRDLDLGWSEDNAIKITLQRALLERLFAIRDETT